MSGAELWVFQVMMWATVVGVDQTTRPLCFDAIMKPQMFQHVSTILTHATEVKNFEKQMKVWES